jgi:hypothetical protein
MNEAQIEAVAQANAFLNNAGLPLIQERVVKIKIKNVYGSLKIYPANQAAELFAAIAGVKTLSNVQLAYAERLGFQIKQVEAYQLAGAEA